jgi:hypothetical protein
MGTELILGTGARLSHYHVAEPQPGCSDTRGSVYLDTSVPSYLVARLSRDLTTARRQRLTRLWWEAHRHEFSIYVSTSVTVEARAGDANWAQRRMDLLSRFPELTSTSQTDELAAALVRAAALPSNAIVDADHIAIAAVNEIDFLLTWNCKHLANAHVAHKIVRTCEVAGFRTPKICTPETLMRICADEMPNP